MLVRISQDILIHYSGYYSDSIVTQTDGHTHTLNLLVTPRAVRKLLEK